MKFIEQVREFNAGWRWKLSASSWSSRARGAMVVKQTRRRRRGASVEPALAAQQPQQQVINCGHSFHQDEQSKGDAKLIANASLLDHVVEFDRKFSAWVHEHGLGIFFYVFLRTLEFSGDGVFLIPCAAATFLAPKSKLTPELRMFFFNLFMAFLFDSSSCPSSRRSCGGRGQCIIEATSKPSKWITGRFPAVIPRVPC